MNRSDFTAFSTDSATRRQRSRRPAARSSASANSARSERARGLRTLQHQSLPAATRFAIDTEVWLRSLVLEGWAEAEPPPHPRWATKDQVHDEALTWFLGQREGRKLAPPARTRATGEDVTFWLDSRLLGRARQLAHRSGMRLAHLIEEALGSYVSAHVPAQLLAFRRRVQLEARRRYRQRTMAAPGSRVPARERVAQRASAKQPSAPRPRSRRPL